MTVILAEQTILNVNLFMYVMFAIAILCFMFVFFVAWRFASQRLGASAPAQMLTKQLRKLENKRISLLQRKRAEAKEIPTESLTEMTKSVTGAGGGKGGKG
jgi:hypothetical protein